MIEPLISFCLKCLCENRVRSLTKMFVTVNVRSIAMVAQIMLGKVYAQ